MQAAQGQFSRADPLAATDVQNRYFLFFSQFFDPQEMSSPGFWVNVRKIDPPDPDPGAALLCRFEELQQSAAVVDVVMCEDDSVQLAHSPAMQEGNEGVFCKLLLRGASPVNQKMPASGADVDPVSLSDIEKDHLKSRRHMKGDHRSTPGHPYRCTYTGQSSPLPVIPRAGKRADFFHNPGNGQLSARIPRPLNPSSDMGHLKADRDHREDGEHDVIQDNPGRDSSAGDDLMQGQPAGSLREKAVEVQDQFRRESGYTCSAGNYECDCG